MAARLQAHTEELHAVAASLDAAAATLAALPELVHQPIAADEVSSSAALRLTAHGAVLRSRAADASAVLASAAQALHEAGRVYDDMDRANASAVALRGHPGFAGPVMTPAVTADMPAPFVPISPPVPRDGELAAALLEAGNPDAGTPFASGCGTYAAAFRAGARAARTAQATVSTALQGEAGPRIGAALGDFANWADQMGDHSETLAGLAGGHKGRFLTARHDTPSTRDFATTRQELANADELNRRTRGAYTGVVTQLQTDLAGLHTRAGVAAENYHLTELPAAPPPPPAVVAIVSDPTPGTPQPATPGPGAGQDDAPRGARAGDGADAPADAPDADPGPAAAAGTGLPADPSAGDSMAQALPTMAASLPSMLAGALGGVVGMAAAIPEQIGQQVQSLASQAVEGISGLTSEISKPDTHDTPADTGPGLADAGDLGAAGGGDAGGGATDPAAGAAILPSSDAGMLAAGAPPTPTPLVGQAATAAGVPAAAAGPGGMPMFMPPMGGMGAASGGGARKVDEPDKTIHLPADPNAAPVKGDVARRPTAVADDPTAKAKQAAPMTVKSSEGRRRIIVPKDDRGE